MEIEVAGLEVELGLAGRHRFSLLVLGDETEVRFPRKCLVGLVGPCLRVEPATAAEPAATR